jgi:branched-chain amino acid transport system ATP-binding protein
LAEHECQALIALIADIKKTGVAIVWIEHVVHALLASVDRLVVLHNGAFIADGVPQSVIRKSQVAEIYMGMETDA